jgi:hypothetical protein
MMLSGETTTRLNELKKYKPTNIFTEKYISGGDLNNNGVDYASSVEGEKVIYFINGIKYIDELDEQRTVFEFEPNHGETQTQNLVKLFDLSDVINKPKIKNDVFISRQQIPVFVENRMLEELHILYELTTFAGGGHYKIIKNT